MAATQACRMSIKANDYISEEDQIYLLEELRKLPLKSIMFEDLIEDILKHL